jgi:hypothetical protein
MDRKTLVAAVLVSLSWLPSAAQAQAATTPRPTTARQTTSKPTAPKPTPPKPTTPAKPRIAAGATVYGPEGNAVGTIERVYGQTVVLDTGTNKATLAASAIGTGAKGLTIGFTREQLDQTVERALQAAAGRLTSALVVGAPLRSMDGLPLGTIRSIGADGTVVVARPGGDFSARREQFGTDAQGLIVRLTAQQIDHALNGKASAQR